MRKVLIKIIVLVPVFVASLLFFNWFFNTRNAAVVLQMEEPTFPTVSFKIGEETFNTLNGYDSPRKIPLVRDTITPTDGRHTIQTYIHPYGNTIKKVEYNVYDLSGEQMLESAEILTRTDDTGDILGEIQYTDTWASYREAVLELKITRQKDENLYFYTRITRESGVNAEGAIAFAKRLCLLTQDSLEYANIESMLEADTEGPTGTLQHVTIGSEADQVMWKGVTLQNMSEIQVQMTESNTSYCSLVLRYTIQAGDGTNFETYKVREFYRVRRGINRFYLLSFDRQMDVIYERMSMYLTSTGLDLGVMDPDVDYRTNEEGDYITYVAGDSIWQYRPQYNELIKIFSFYKETNNDERDSYEGHKLKLLHMDDLGNVSFLVNGYMNSDEYEGCTGTDVYLFNAESETVTSLAYFSSESGAGQTMQSPMEVLYYSHSQKALYYSMEGNIERVETSTGKTRVEVENFSLLLHRLSEDGSSVAYQKEDGKTIAVLNMETGESWNITEENEEIRPLGFVDEDLAYGLAREKDAGVNILGEKVSPMYKVRIVSAEGEVLKEYNDSSSMVSDGWTSDGVLNLSRVVFTGSVYTEAASDYISVNKEETDAVVTLETYQDPVMKESVRFVINRHLRSKQPRKIVARLLLNQNKEEMAQTVEDSNYYYVYGTGRVSGIFANAGSAIVTADNEKGVVVDSSGEYLWERGNRDLVWTIENVTPVLSQGNVVAAAAQTILNYKGIQGDIVSLMNDGKGVVTAMRETCEAAGTGEVLELSGLLPEQLCFLINKNIPILAMLGEGYAIVFTGYDEDGMKYLELTTCTEGYLPMEDAISVCWGGGYRFLGIR